MRKTNLGLVIVVVLGLFAVCDTACGIELFNGVDLSGWMCDETPWEVKDGILRNMGAGDGYDRISYNTQLPGDEFSLEIRMRVVGHTNDYPRPRIWLNNNPRRFWFGNEGFTYQYEVYGSDLSNVKQVGDDAYSLGGWYTLRVEVDDQNQVSFFKDGILTHTATRIRNVPLDIIITPGDGWSQGNIEIFSIMYEDTVPERMTVDFDDQYSGAIVHDQYRSEGVLFSSVDFDPGTYTINPVFDGVVVSNHWPTSAPRSVEPTQTGLFQLRPFPNFPALQMEFVIPGTNIPATTDYVSLFLDAATDEGDHDTVTMFGFGRDGDLLFSSSRDDYMANWALNLVGEEMHKVVVVLEQGSGIDIETYDDVCFNMPIPWPEPLDLLRELSESIDAMNLEKGTANSLQAKLDTAMQLLEDDNENSGIAAINSLWAFINAVETQYDKKISQPNADILIVTAREILELLNDEQN